MTTSRIAVAILMFALFASPFAVTAQEVSPEETPSIEVATDPAPEEEFVGEILATSTEWVFETEKAQEEPVSDSLADIDPDTYAPGELIVVFENELSERDFQEVTNTPSVESIEALTEDGTIALIQTDEPLEAVIAELEASPDIAYVEPNYVRSIEAFSSWSLDTIDAPEAWAVATGTDVIIAVIDTGVDYTHPDLAGHMWDGTSCVSDTGVALGGCVYGYDFADNDADPAPVSASTSWQHGTHIAGIANGIAPGAKVMALRFGLTVSSEIKAINFARENGARIINASYTGSSFSQTEHDAIQAFTEAGGIFVSVSGNSAKDIEVEPAYPGSYDLSGIITVTATNQQDELASFSSFGEASVDLGAPGTAILSTYPNNQFATASGTSMAAPHVAGVVALLKQKFPSLSADDVKERILTTGDALPALLGKTVSGKRVNAHRALTVDFKAPVLTLLGDVSMNLTSGSTFTDPGATALDDFDGDISANIVISGAVDTNTSGSYTREYSVADAQGNTATTTRTVTISPAPQVSSGGGGGGGGGGGSSKKKKEAQKKKEAEKKAREEARKKASAKSSVATTTQAVDPIRLPQTIGSVLGSSTNAPSSSYIFTLNLSLGSSGPEVTALQTRLVSLGLLSVTPTGYYGSLTQTAVMAYQRSKGIAPLGVVGPMTRASLNSN